MYNYQDKEQNLKIFTDNMFNRSLNMFHYDNLPVTIPAIELEKLLQSNGFVVIAEFENNLYAFNAGFSGQDVYGNSTHAIITNPALKFNKTLEIGKDCVLFKNDDTFLGLKSLYEKYGRIIVESDISIIVENYNTRIQTLISANDDNTIESAKQYLDKIVAGELGIIGESKLFDSLKVQGNSSSKSNNITDLLELQQYMKASLYNEIGLDANYNMKRERLNTSEVAMNTDNLFPLVDNMFKNRETSLKQINEVFGTNIDVEFTSIWKIKQDDLQNVSEIPDDETEKETDKNMLEEIYNFLTKPDEVIEEIEEIEGGEPDENDLQ